jgi:sugar phosphate isomerase/epimerase
MSRVKLYKTLWGAQDLASPLMWGAMFKRIRDQGFEGVELVGPVDGPFFPFKGHVADFKGYLKEHDLGLIVQLHTLDYPVPSKPWKAHLESLQQKAEATVRDLTPELINVHSGKDSFDRDSAVNFFQAAVKVEEDIGITMTHETHRQRVLFSPMVLKDLKGDLPTSLKLNADLSHFCCVCERILSDEHDADMWPEVLEFVAERCHLIHARVGWAQGPQVNDPFAPEHASDVAEHFKWWKRIVASMRRRGVVPRVEPEFGPYPYQPHLPYTMVPTADLDAINCRFGVRLREELNQD